MQKHTLHIENDRLEYLLERKKRKTISLRITSQGLVVSAPERLPLPLLEASIRSKLGWIGQRLRAVMQAQTAPNHALFLGRELELRAAPELSAPRFSGGVLELPNASPEALERWYRAQARTHISARVAHFAGDRKPRRIAITGAKGRWGSCSSEGNLNFSWRTMRLPPDLIDYVVAHELAHLEHMDHSPRFWSALERTMPDYRERHAALKKVPIV